MDFVTNFHLDTYPALSPRRAELSQEGRTVFITGGASGVGLEISRAFLAAGAARLVLVGRRPGPLAEVKEQLEKASNSKLEVLTYPCDIVDSTAVQGVWDDLKSKNIGVDVLVLNATIAQTTPNGLAEDDLVTKVWSTFEMNVLSAMRLTDLFIKQGPTKGKAIVSLNASAAHISPVRPVQLAYGPSKAALGSLMQAVADVLDPEDVQIVSYHPGSIKTEATMNSKWANAPIAWNTATLPGEYAVWASSKEARFLHGRFTWSNWDVEELKSMKEFEHPGFCRVGLQGPNLVSADDLWVQMANRVQKGN